MYMFMADLVVFALTIIFFDDFSGQLDQDLAFVRPHPAWPRVRVPAPWRRARRRHCPDLIGPVYAPELPGGGGMAQILSENTVPALFLAIAMLEFILMILDRMVYTSKSLRWKLLIQWATVIGFHVWIFFVLPAAKQCVRAPMSLAAK